MLILKRGENENASSKIEKEGKTLWKNNKQVLWSEKVLGYRNYQNFQK